MKKIFLTLALAFCIVYLNAQDEAVIQLYATAKKLGESENRGR